MPSLPGPRDLIDALRTQAESLAGLPAVLTGLTRGVTSLHGSAESLAVTIERADDLTARAGRLLDALEAPLLALAPALGEVALAADGALVGQLVATVRDAPRLVGQVEDLLGRLSTVADQAAVVAAHAGTVSDGAAQVADQAAGAFADVKAVTDSANAAIAGIRTVSDRASTTVAGIQTVVDVAADAVTGIATTTGRAADTVTAAGGAVSDTESLLGQARGLLQSVEAPVRQLLPLLGRLADVVDGPAVDGIAALLRRTPELVERVDSEVFPALQVLREAMPDLHTVMEVVERLEPVVAELHTLAAGLPGAGLFRRRGEREEAAHEAEQEHDHT